MDIDLQQLRKLSGSEPPIQDADGNAVEFKIYCNYCHSRLDVLRMAIDKLSENHRKLIILRYFRDLSQTETARILGLTQVKVSREEKKIMEILRRELS